MWFKLFSQLSIGMVIILSGAVASVYYVLKYDKGDDIQQEIQSMEEQKDKVAQTIEDLKKELGNLQDMDKAMNLMGGEINKFLEFMPNEVSSSTILSYLNEIARSAGVELENIVNHKVSETQEFYEKLKVSVTVRGLFTQIVIFLSQLTNLETIVTVENFNMENLSKDKGHQEVKVRMDIYGYRYVTPIIAQQSAKKTEKEVPP